MSVLKLIVQVITGWILERVSRFLTGWYEEYKKQKAKKKRLEKEDKQIKEAVEEGIDDLKKAKTEDEKHEAITDIANKF